MNIALKYALSVSLVGLVAACNKSNEPEASAPTTKAADAVLGPRAQTASATDSIAESRCSREKRCDNIGGDKKFSSTEDCLTRVRTDWKADLNARECPGGVNQTQLDQCLTEIRNEDCGSPFDTLERVAACTAGQICQG